MRELIASGSDVSGPSALVAGRLSLALEALVSLSSAVVAGSWALFVQRQTYIRFNMG